MAGVYLKIGAINGPIPSVAGAVTGAQPSGVALTDLFQTQGINVGVSIPTANPFAGGSSQESAAPSPQDLGLGIDDSQLDPNLFGAAAAGTSLGRVAVIATAAQTNGFTGGDWIRWYWLLDNAKITQMQSYGETGGSWPQQYLAISYGKIAMAHFALPTAGGTGARTFTGWNYMNNTPWNGT